MKKLSDKEWNKRSKQRAKWAYRCRSGFHKGCGGKRSGGLANPGWLPCECPCHAAAWKADCIKWRGKELTGKYSHWCNGWDGLPIDETCPEWPCECAEDLMREG